MMPKEECEVLLDAVLSASTNLLKKNKDFYPIGAVLTYDGTITYTAIHSDNEFPDSESVICDLTTAHKQKAESNEIKASGIAWNATIATSDGKQSDAIVVSLEHQDNYSVIVGLPYKFGLFKKIQFGELFAEEGKNDIF